jgi:HSP20 family protein
MADVRVNKNPQSEQKSSERGESRSIARRGAYDPFGFSIMPSEFFSTNPFSLMRRMHDEMDRIFAEGFGQGFGGGEASGRSSAWAPAVEVSEREGNYVVCAELPGLIRMTSRLRSPTRLS